MSRFDSLRASGAHGLARDLSLPELSSFGVTSSAPMTVVAGAAVAIFALGVPGTPLLFLAVGAICGLWAIGYAALSEHVQSAGAQAAFITRGLGRSAGIAAQGVALVAYTAIYVCLYGLFGVVSAPVIARLYPDIARSRDVSRIAEHVSRFSLAAIRGLRGTRGRA